MVIAHIHFVHLSASAPAAARVRAIQKCRRSFGRHGAFISFIGDPVQGAGEIVGDDERAVGELRHVHRTPVVGALFVEPAFGENFRLVACAIGFQRGKRDPRADRYGSVPGTVLAKKIPRPRRRGTARPPATASPPPGDLSPMRPGRAGR
jgi:hypothetical protein